MGEWGCAHSPTNEASISIRYVPVILITKPAELSWCLTSLAFKVTVTIISFALPVFTVKPCNAVTSYNNNIIISNNILFSAAY